MLRGTSEEIIVGWVLLFSILCAVHHGRVERQGMVGDQVELK